MRTFFKKIATWILRLEVKIYLWRTRPFIIAVAGITNKAVQRHAVATEFQKRGIFDVWAHPRGLNTETGLPLAILQVETFSFAPLYWPGILWRAAKTTFFPSDKRPKIIVVEYGVSQAGDMKRLLAITKPHLLIVTDIIDHPQSQVSARILTAEMSALVHNVLPGGYAVLPADSPFFPLLKAAVPSRVTMITYGCKEEADYRAAQIEYSESGTRFIVRGLIHEIHQRGEHNVLAALASQATVDTYVQKK